MVDLVPSSAGRESQMREFHLNEILKVFPERATDPNLIYGNIELEYYRLVNDGKIIIPTAGENSAAYESKITVSSNISNIQNTVQPRWEGAQ